MRREFGGQAEECSAEEAGLSLACVSRPLLVEPLAGSTHTSQTGASLQLVHSLATKELSHYYNRSPGSVMPRLMVLSHL